MKITKILTDILKSVGNLKSKMSYYGVDKGYVYYAPDGFRMYKIPQDNFLIDLEKAFPGKTPISDPKKLLNDSDAVAAVKTNEVRCYEKYNVIKIKNENTHAWINVNYLKEFEANCTFKIVNEKSPVFIYEFEELTGIILPVFIKEE